MLLAEAALHVSQLLLLARVRRARLDVASVALGLGLVAPILGLPRAHAALVADGVELRDQRGRLALVLVHDHRAALLQGLALALLLDLWLGLERQLRLQRLGHLERRELARRAVHCLVHRVSVERRRLARLAAHLPDGAHAAPLDAGRREHGVGGHAKPWHVNGHPRAQEDDVREQQLVLERAAASALAAAVGGAQGLLDLAAHARHRAHARALELGHLERAAEHVLDEGGVLERLEGVAHELQLLHHADLGVALQRHARGGHAEAARIGAERRKANQAGVLRDHRAEEAREAVHVLRRVLEHSLATVGVLRGEERERLEAAPAARHDHGIAILQNLARPAVLLEARLHEAVALLLRGHAAQHHGASGVEVLHQLLGHAVQQQAHVRARAVALQLHAPLRVEARGDGQAARLVLLEAPLLLGEPRLLFGILHVVVRLGRAAGGLIAPAASRRVRVRLEPTRVVGAVERRLLREFGGASQRRLVFIFVAVAVAVAVA